MKDDLKNKYESLLPIGHHAIVNSHVENGFPSPNIAIYGLGSCIALIICDKEKHLAGMSHILLPNSENRQNVKIVHKYANLSVDALVSELLKKGADSKRLEAYVIGGSQIFSEMNCDIGKDNAFFVKKELKKNNIKIIKEDIGGSYGRFVLFDTTDFKIFVKTSDEKVFKQLKDEIK